MAEATAEELALVPSPATGEEWKSRRRKEDQVELERWLDLGREYREEDKKQEQEQEVEVVEQEEEKETNGQSGEPGSLTPPRAFNLMFQTQVMLLLSSPLLASPRLASPLPFSFLTSQPSRR